MFEARMQFEKMGQAAYISHLDLMKTLQRAFCRAQLPVRYSQGFNPHIYLSILAPLSTGYQSLCELCDFDLEEEPDGTMVSRVNQSLPTGILSLRIEERGRPVRDIAYCQWEISWREGSAVQAAQVFSRPILVEKKSKRSTSTVALGDFIRDISFFNRGENLVCQCTLRAGDKALNPLYITEGLINEGVIAANMETMYLREEILDENGNVFF